MLQGIDLDNEALIFRCKGLVPNAGEAARFAAATASSLSPGDADPAASAAWTLTSRPDASKKLWLDFRGGVVTSEYISCNEASTLLCQDSS